MEEDFIFMETKRTVEGICITCGKTRRLYKRVQRCYSCAGSRRTPKKEKILKSLRPLKPGQKRCPNCGRAHWNNNELCIDCFVASGKNLKKKYMAIDTREFERFAKAFLYEKIL